MAEHQTDRIIHRHERRRLVPYSDNHVQRLERKGLFPLRVKLCPSRVGWLLSGVLDWVDRGKDNRQGHDNLVDTK